MLESGLRNLCAILLVWLGYTVDVHAEAAVGKQGVMAESVYECADPGYRSFIEKNYVLFEVGQVHPLELSADGKWLFALNSPLGCLEIYRVEDSGLQLASSVAVGIQPVSVRVRNSQEIWVVNHLSDNVSVVDLSGRPKVKQILQVGDAPYDVAFAAKDIDGQATRAYVSCSARGQHHPTFALPNLVSNIVEYQENGEIKRDKLGMADLWVYDIHTDASLEGIINPFMADLRSLAVSDDGKTVYGAGFHSGNETTSIRIDPKETTVVTDENLISVANARIVKKTKGQWKDNEGKDWSDHVSIDLPDVDVIAVDASRQPLPFNKFGKQVVANTNRQLIKETFSGMGSILFSLAVDGDRLLLTALDSHNEIPLEENLVGKATSNMLLVQQGQNRERINLDELSTKKAEGTIPLPGAIHVGKKYIYVAGFGSSRIGFFKRTSTLANFTLAGIMDLRQSQSDTAVTANSVAGMGPAGIAELPSGAVVVLSRLDNALHVLKQDESKPDHFVALQIVDMFSPETTDIVQGRRFLYDADTTGNGKTACASCHIFGDWDGLAWDLGSKARKLASNDNPFIYIKGALIENMANTVRVLPIKISPDDYKTGEQVPVGRYQLPLCFKGSADELHKKLQEKAFGTKPCALYVTEVASSADTNDYHAGVMGSGNQWASVNFPYFNSLKGPMTTQTLFGLAYGGPMHHQGDKTGTAPATGNHCPDGRSVEERAFKEFNQPCDGSNSSFVSLLGGRQLQIEEMDTFSRFVLHMHFPPNPHRAFDNSVPAEWQKLFSDNQIAKDITSSKALMLPQTPGVASCSHCHMLDPLNGHFGSANDRYYSAPPVTQDLDVPDFRAFYRKLGLYAKDSREYLTGNPDMLDNKQVSGFGYFHNATFDPVDAVFNPAFFKFPKDKINSKNENIVDYDIGDRMNLFYFLSLFDTDVFPLGGQQYLAEAAGSAVPLENSRYCNEYGFMDGKFFQNKQLKSVKSSILTCYPKLQAEINE